MPIAKCRAVQLDRYGNPEVMTIRVMQLTELKPDEIRIRTLYAAINYTDLQIRAGAWPIRKSDPFPYVPGVEAVGSVVDIGSEVAGCSLGQIVITMMQGLGGVRAERMGAYAEFVTVAADAVAHIPTGMAPEAIASLGLPSVTAFEGLRRLGSLLGRSLLVTGAGGSVGAAAVAIGAAMGARVTGLVARPEQMDLIGPHEWSGLFVSVRLPPAPWPAAGGAKRSRRAAMAASLLPGPAAGSPASCAA
jgi:NADPH2:quinone reductase